MHFITGASFVALFGVLLCALPATIALPPTLAFPPMPAFPPTRMPSDDMCATQDAYFMAGHWCKDRFSADGDQETSQLRLPVLV